MRVLFRSVNDVLFFDGRTCVPNENELQRQILTEAHETPYSVHPGSTKMYQGFREHFWWNGMKGDVAKFVSKNLTCQKVKAEHKRPAGELQPIEVFLNGSGNKSQWILWLVYLRQLRVMMLYG